MIEELKEKGMPVNGFLDKSEPVTFGEDGITVHVSAGRQILESVELPRVLAEMIQERTGSLPVVRLADSGKARTEEEFEQYLQEKAPVVKFEAKETPPDFTIEGLALTNKPVKLFYGKQFKPTDTRRLNDLGDGGKVTVWGDVFATEVKGSRRKIYFTSITDYSGSVNLKVMGEEGADMSKWEGLKPERPSSSAATICTTSTSMTLSSCPTTFCRSSVSSARIPRPTAKSASSCTCTPSPARWTASTTPARSCVWLTAWATAPLPSPTTASARATPKRCWPPMPSTKQTRTLN